VPDPLLPGRRALRNQLQRQGREVPETDGDRAAQAVRIRMERGSTLKTPTPGELNALAARKPAFFMLSDTVSTASSAQGLGDAGFVDRFVS
jgi:hypothetical protein